MKLSMFKIQLFTALAQNLLLPRYNQGMTPKNDSVAFGPKRTKFKGWQRQARDAR